MTPIRRALFRLCLSTMLLMASVVRVDAADAQGEANKQLVIAFLKDIRQAAFIAHDPQQVRAVSERYMTVNYLQHSEGYGAGREGFIERMSTLALQGKGQAPMPAPKMTHALADGDLVVWVSEVTLPDPDDRHKTQIKQVFNMVRIDHGRLAEHWSAD